MEQLAQLPLESQLKELLDKTKELRIENTNLQDTISTKDQKISELSKQVQQSSKYQRHVAEEIETEVEKKTKHIRNTLKHKFEEEYGSKARKLTALTTASLTGCIILLIALITKSPAYLRDAGEVWAHVVTGFVSAYNTASNWIVVLNGTLFGSIQNQMFRSGLSALVALIAAALVLGAVGAIAYPLAKRLTHINHQKLPKLLLGIICAIAIPVAFAPILRIWGVNTCLVSIVGVGVALIAGTH